MSRNNRNALIAFVAIFAFVIGYLGFAGSASANVEPCVPKDAYTEVIEHPEVSHEETITVVDEEAYTEVIPGVDGQHYSWTGGHLSTDNPPTAVPPHDDWQANTSQEPHDSNGNPATWVNESLHYTANSKGHASWFYYVHPVPEQVIEHPAVTHDETVKVVDKEAWTETIEHPAVVCETPTETPSVPTETPIVPTVTETPVETPVVPAAPIETLPAEATDTETPEVEKSEEPKPGQKKNDDPVIENTVHCEDGVWVKTKTKDGVVVSETSSGSCEPDPVNVVPTPIAQIKEEGL